MQTIKHFEGTRRAAGPQDRVENIRAAAQDFRKSMLAGPKVRYYESFDLVQVPYPSYYGLRHAFRYEHVLPYLSICNRLFVCQFDTPNGVKTLLISPSDYEYNRETPFFKRLSDSNPKWMEGLILKRHSTVEQVLAKIGLKPEDVDYITYDHLHTQHVRRWLGTAETRGVLPNAKLIVHRQEWESALRLTPIQYDWYCPDGIKGIPEDRVIFVEGDVMLGDGVAMIHTPGHTEGNHSMVVHTNEGLWVTSENGVTVDAYAPKISRIAGLSAYAKANGSEVILNGNTLENSIDQYISMVQELTIAGPSARNADFPNNFPSSELTPFWLAPGVRSSHRVGHARHGALVKAG